MSLTQKLSTCEGVSVLLGTFKKISTQNFSILKIFISFPLPEKNDISAS